MVRKPRAYKRSQRKQQVIKQLMIWYQNGYATEATSYKLARALDLRATQHFADILHEMVQSLGLYWLLLNKGPELAHERD